MASQTEWYGIQLPGNVQVGVRGNTVVFKYGAGAILMPRSVWLAHVEEVKNGDFDAIGDYRHGIPNPRTTR